MQLNADGTRIERFPDGRKIQTDTLGTVTEQLADGTVMPPKQPKITQKCVSCSKCLSIVTVPSDSFVICCPFCQQIMLGHEVQVIGSTKSVAEGLATKTSRPLWDSSFNAASDVKKIFDRYDRNKSGGIDTGELENMLLELNFPQNAFNNIFQEADANNDGELQFSEFITYFNELNSAVIALAAMPDLSMSAQMMEEQRALLLSAKDEMKSRLNKIETDLKTATITNCDDLANEKRLTEEQITSIEKELALRERHLETAIKEQHKRRRDALQKRLSDRAKGKTPPGSPQAEDDKNNSSN